MIQNLGSLAGISRRMLVLAVALPVSLAMLVGGSAALATPTGDYAPFADCPLSNSSLADCIVANTTSGEFTVGNTTVPINKTITLQGGIIAGEPDVFVGAADGNTLTKTALTVPGGLLGIVAPSSWPGWLQAIFNNFINEGLTGVTATTELAGPASAIGISLLNLLDESGTALSLPVKVKLGNAFLGNSCYIGSNSSPITLNLTSGTTSPPPPNNPITGSRGTLEFKDGGNLIVDTGNSLVDNSYAAPAANGCGGIFSFLVDPAVDLKLGLPSAAGHNVAVLSGTTEIALASAVRASE
jgi:hypothetical protein